MAAPAPNRRAEGFYRELELVRIQWSKSEELGLAVASAAAREAAAALGSKLVLPLGLCFLPAFVVLGIVPTVIATGMKFFE